MEAWQSFGEALRFLPSSQSPQVGLHGTKSATPEPIGLSRFGGVFLRFAFESPPCARLERSKPSERPAQHPLQTELARQRSFELHRQRAPNREGSPKHIAQGSNTSFGDSQRRYLILKVVPSSCRNYLFLPIHVVRALSKLQRKCCKNQGIACRTSAFSTPFEEDGTDKIIHSYSKSIEQFCEIWPIDVEYADCVERILQRPEKGLDRQNIASSLMNVAVLTHTGGVCYRANLRRAPFLRANLHHQRFCMMNELLHRATFAIGLVRQL
jgi:hypothetical protein